MIGKIDDLLFRMPCTLPEAWAVEARLGDDALIEKNLSESL
jgi:hypothetical protein